MGVNGSSSGATRRLLDNSDGAVTQHCWTMAGEVCVCVGGGGVRAGSHCETLTAIIYYTLVWYGACSLEFNAGDISIVAYGGAYHTGVNDASAILRKTTETAEVKT